MKTVAIIVSAVFGDGTSTKMFTVKGDALKEFVPKVWAESRQKAFRLLNISRVTFEEIRV